MAIKAKSRPEKDRSERWLLTYADLITLLMVFFVILFSFSIIDVKRFQDLKGSLDKAFNQGVLAGLNTTSISGQTSYGTVTEAIKSDRDNAVAAAASQLQQVVDATGAGDQVTVNEVAQGVTVSRSSDLLFQSGSAQLKPGATQLIQQIATPLKTLNNPIQIIGNTDDVPPAATNSQYQDNFQLSQARANSVLHVLVDQNQFPPARLSVWGKGEFAPIAPNDTPEHRAQNRRVDLLILFPTDQAPAFPSGSPAAAPALQAAPAAGGTAAVAKPAAVTPLQPAPAGASPAAR